MAAAVVSGIARGCRSNGCALIGGETAEMPGLYADGEYDLAGTIVGVAEKNKVITGEGIRAGDLLIGFAFYRTAYERLLARAQDTLRDGGYKVDAHVPELGVYFRR